MKRGLIVAGFAVAVAHGAPPARPATDFKGYALGAPAPLEKLAEEWLLRCKDQFSGKKLCTGYSSVGNVHAELTVTIGESGELEDVFAVFKADRYSVVRTAALAKYGKPTKERRAPVQTKAGATFPSETLSWTRKDGAQITLTMHAETINQSALLLQSRESVAEMLKAERSRKVDL